MVDRLIVRPGVAAAIAERDAGDRLGLRKQEGEQRLGALVERIDELQYRLFAEDRRSVLLVLQGLDASGKDGVLRRVFHGVNPAGVSVTSFRAPVGVGARARLPLADPRRAPGARPHRRLQPLPLRGRRRRADAEARAGGRLAPPLRASPRLRAAARRRGHDGAQGLPQRLARGAAKALPGADRRSRRSAGSSAARTSRCESGSATGCRPGRRR